MDIPARPAGAFSLICLVDPLLRFRRQLATALTLLYLMVGVVAPLAHALEEDASHAAPVHVTAPGKDSCPPVHNHLHCRTCTHAGKDLLAPSTLVEWMPQVALASPLRSAGRTLVRSAPQVSPPGSRAPPLA